VRTLDDLNSAGLSRACAVIGTVDALFHYLAARPEVHALRKAISVGSITQAQIDTFTEQLLGRFERGKRFSGDIAFAAIAVALATVPDRQAGAYLRQLASARVLELPMSPRVAALAIGNRLRHFGQVLYRREAISSLVPVPNQEISEERATSPQVATPRVPPALVFGRAA
jgi:hypothetical protein